MLTFLSELDHVEEYASTMKFEYNPGFERQVEPFFKDLFDEHPAWHRLLDVDREKEEHIICERESGKTIFSILVSPAGVKVRGAAPGTSYDEWTNRAICVYGITVERFVAEFPQKVTHLDVEYRLFFRDKENPVLDELCARAGPFFASARDSAVTKNLSALMVFPGERRFRLDLGLSESDNTAIVGGYAQLYSRETSQFDAGLLGELIQESKEVFTDYINALFAKTDT